MAVRVSRGRSDAAIKKIVEQLEQYAVDHPKADIEVYRKNSTSIRVRVVDPSFRTLSRSERSRMVWPLLRELPEETLSEISMVLLLSPEEKKTSLVSLEFDDPSRSQL
jgi:stress-induced morphogen